MAMRMTGMMSGMDTESIIQELVAVRKKKVDTKKKEQTKLDWKAEAWKELNTKLKKLQTKFIANMRFSDAYSKKTTKVSNSNAVSIITGESAMNGVQTMKVTQLAKSGYLTSGKIEGSGVTALSKLGDIGYESPTDPADPAGVFTVKNGDKYVDITVNEGTTISDVLNQIKSVGLNANFDAKQQRFYITAVDSGEEADFSFTASNEKGLEAMKALGLDTEIGDKKDKGQDYASWTEYKLYQDWENGDSTATDTINERIKADIDSQKAGYLAQYRQLKDSQKAAEDVIKTIEDKYSGSTLDTVDSYKAALGQKEAAIKSAQENGRPAGEIEQLQKEADEIRTKLADAQTLADQRTNISNYNTQIAEIGKHIVIEETNPGSGEYEIKDTTNLEKEVNDRYDAKADYAVAFMLNIPAVASAKKVSGQDAIIELNGAEYTNNDNTFEINGLTITALAATDEEITVTTQRDTDGIYDMVKNFLKEYNEVVNEMDKLYNADRAKGYEPLTDEEKDSMSEKEIEKWETKVKDSLLRRDENLSSVNSALQSIMSSGFTVNGKTMYLYDFGIETLGYFQSADNEKHAYHIAGDLDDEYTMNSEDKLKGMIANDPDTVISFFSQLSRSLHEKMTDMSKSVDGYRSFGNFYDDKKMKSDYDDYTTKIKEMETKLNEYEDKWYKKFSKMETALAKMQSNMSAVSSLLGG